MRTFVHKKNPAQEAKSVSSARPAGRAFSGQSREVRSIVRLQRTIGNQAVQRLLQANAEVPEAGSATTASTSFTHDFSRIRLHAKAHAEIQPRLTISNLRDIYEQEADRVADQVMRISEPQLQRSCPCGGGCPKCQARELDQETEHLHRNSVQSSGTGGTAVPPIVHDVLSAPGRSLDPTVRRFMESRFGHDFSQVRVHADARAADSAGAVNALAYTVGQDIVFGPGRYAPQTSEGRRLLAHELTHVVQQHASRQTTSAMPGQAAMQSRRALMREPVPAQPPSLGQREETPLETHQKYLKNVLLPAVTKIGSVQTPYSEALHALYSAGLGQAQSSPLVPKPGDPANNYPEVAIEVTVGSMKKKIMFRLVLFQDPSAVNAQTFVISDKAQIVLNELSYGARNENLAEIEETMVHEGMHVLSDLVTEANTGAAPGIPANAPNLDQSSYSSQRQAIERAVLPVIQGAFLHEPGGVARHTKEQYAVWAEITANTFVKEAIARVEGAIYAKQRSNQPFTKDDIPDPDFMLIKDYWSIEGGDLAWSLNKFRTLIDEDMRPQVISVQETYLATRPQPQPAGP